MPSPAITCRKSVTRGYFQGHVLTELLPSTRKLSNRCWVFIVSFRHCMIPHSGTACDNGHYCPPYWHRHDCGRSGTATANCTTRAPFVTSKCHQGGHVGATGVVPVCREGTSFLRPALSSLMALSRPSPLCLGKKKKCGRKQ
jgi:hypothetical protein